MASLKFFAVRLVLEIDSEEEVDHASGVSRRREAEEGVFDGCVLCAEEDGGEVCFVEGVVEVCLEANGRFVTEDIEGLDAGGAEIGVEIAGTVPGVATYARCARGADLEVFLAAAGEIGAVDIGSIGAGVVSSAEVGGRSCGGDGRCALN